MHNLSYDYISHGANDGEDYGVPEEKKFPLDSREHVISAVKFFNYCKPRYRRVLARKIIAKVKEYGITLTPSDDNDFYNYYQPPIAHYGIEGMRWGVRRFQNEDGTLTPAGKKRYLNDMASDQDSYFKSKLSDKAKSYGSINRGGYSQSSTRLSEDFRNHKLTSKEVSDIERESSAAAKETRKYMQDKYGSKNMKAFQRSGELFVDYGKLDIDVNYSGKKQAKKSKPKTEKKTVSKSSKRSVTKMSESDTKEFKDHISSREFKKQATEIWKQHKVDSKQTPERKAYDKAMKNLQQYAGHEEGDEWKKAVKETDKAYKAWNDSKNRKADDAWKEISGVALKDLGYDDNDENREYVKKTVALYAR